METEKKIFQNKNKLKQHVNSMVYLKLSKYITFYRAVQKEQKLV
jgi:hypothetical protein